jgi:HEAT repeat protein
MRQIRHYQKIFVPLPGLLLAAAALVATPSATCQEQNALPSEEERLSPAVEALRDALRVQEPAKKDDPAEQNVYKAQLDFRRKTLQERINALRGVRDLYQALALQEWRDEKELNEDIAKIDRDLRQQVEDRFAQTVRGGMKSGQPTQQIAAADLLREIGVKIRGTGGRQNLTSAFAPDLAAMLKDKNPAVVVSAAKALGHINPNPQVVAQALQDLLKSGTASERRAVADGMVSLIETIEALSKSNESLRDETLALCQAVLPVAGRGLADADVAVRRQSALAIQRIGATLAEPISRPGSGFHLPPPGRELSEEDKGNIQFSQESVAKELKEVSGVARALADQNRALGKLLHDEDKETRLQAARALVEMANVQTRLFRLAESVPPLSPEKSKAIDSEPRTKIGGSDSDLPQIVLRQGLTTTLPDLAHALDDPDVRVRLAAVTVLDLMDREAVLAVNALAKALKDSDVFVRWAAARALGNLDPSAGKVAVPGLGRLLFDPDLDPRLAAATTLEHYGNQAGGAVPDLARAIGVGDAEIRIAVIHALEAIGPDAKSAIPALTKALDDPDDRVRRAAADALGRFGPLAVSAEPALRKALNDKEPNVRKAVSGALLNINQK